MTTFRTLGFALAVTLGALQSGGASAAGLQVAPISLTLEAGRGADGLWLSNTGDAPLNAQVRVFHWTQAEGEDRLEASRGLVVSPPMLKLEPGGRQLVRVIRTGAPPGRNEDAFRLLVDEVPDESALKAGLNFLVRHSVPVFVAPAGDGKTATQLSWSLRGDAAGPRLEVANAGSMHAQLASLSFTGRTGGTVAISDGLLGYVLPGSTMHWPLKGEASAFAQGGQMSARINGEPLAPPIDLAAPRP